ncbi:MAG: hypothetical protein U9R75_07325 [Candidatus Thermoplasmatota archaeon]|nr:hypothetical protein [Candidatus Thermoplasmatota archaeon]
MKFGVLGSSVVFLLLCSSLLPGTFPAEGAPRQTVDLVEIRIDTDQVSIDIGFNGTNNAVITCTLVLLADLGILVEYVDVYLEPVIPASVSLVLDTYEIRLTSDAPEYTLNANISVEPGTSATLNPVVGIGGSGKTNRGQTVGVTSDSFSIDVLPYYGSNIFFSTIMGSVVSGETKTFKMNIESTSNIGEHFILEVSNSRELSDQGVHVEFEEARVFVDEGEAKVAEVEIRAGSDADRGAYVVKTRCYPESVGPSTQEQSTSSFTINVDKGYINVIEGFFKDPIYFYITIAVILIALVLGGYGIFKLRQHLAWKRTLKRVKEANKASTKEVTFKMER